ncbi:MAG: hypothetical protein ABJD97_08520 [Betaproteobacteria bacterium]
MIYLGLYAFNTAMWLLFIAYEVAAERRKGMEGGKQSGVAFAPELFAALLATLLAVAIDWFAAPFGFWCVALGNTAWGLYAVVLLARERVRISALERRAN